MAPRNGPKERKGDVSEPASISLGIAQRYALALFELAKEAKNSLDTLAKQ